MTFRGSKGAWQRRLAVLLESAKHARFLTGGVNVVDVDVRVRLLGPVAVEVDGQPVAGFRSHKTLALLALLVTEQRPVARNYLATLFWPDAPLADGRGHLRRALHDLVQKLPGALWLDYYTAQFNPALFAHTDLAQLARHEGAPDDLALEPALALCRGQFLEGIELPDCPEFETWLIVEREAWNLKASKLLEDLLAGHTASGRFQEALEIGWQLLRLAPWNEDYYHIQMLLLVRLRQFAQALRLYQRYQHALTQEFGLEPSEEIEALHTHIRDSRKRRPGNIAPTTPPLAAPSSDVAGLIRDLVDPACRLITLTGPSGYDRNQVAIAAAARANGHGSCLFLDGAFQVHLDKTTTQTDLLTNIAQALGLVSGTMAVAEEVVLRRLRGCEMLLLLCDFDHLCSCKKVLIDLLQANPALKLVVTCRERLALPDERVHTIKDSARVIVRGADAPERPLPADFPALAQQVLARALLTEHYFMI